MVVVTVDITVQELWDEDFFCSYHDAQDYFLPQKELVTRSQEETNENRIRVVKALIWKEHVFIIDSTSNIAAELADQQERVTNWDNQDGFKL